LAIDSHGHDPNGTDGLDVGIGRYVAIRPPHHVLPHPEHVVVEGIARFQPFPGVTPKVCTS
jgi:hypothetical protein